MMRVTLLKLEERTRPVQWASAAWLGERCRFSLGKKGGMDEEEEKRGEEGEIWNLGQRSEMR